MKVRATAPGFYGQYREVGDEFDIGEAQHKASWYEPVKSESIKNKKQEQKLGSDEGE